MVKIVKKTASLALSLALLTQTSLGAVAEANFWKERREAQPSFSSQTPLQLAGLPGSFGGGPLSFSPSFSSDASIQFSKGSLPFPSTPSHRWMSSVPASRANLTDSFFPENPTGSPILLFLDVHQNREAQENIASSLSHLLKENPRLIFAAEGSSGPFDFTPFNSFPARKVLFDVAGRALAENKIGALSYLGITESLSRGVITGMERADLYSRNKRDLTASLKNQMNVLARIEKEENLSRGEALEIFSPDLWNLNEAWSAWEKGKAPISDTLVHLRKAGKRKDEVLDSFLRLLHLEKTLVTPAMESEKRAFMERFVNTADASTRHTLTRVAGSYQRGEISFGRFYSLIQHLSEKAGVPLSDYPAYEKYISYALEAEKVNAEEILQSAVEYVEDSAQALFKSERERVLWAELRQLALREKLAAISLTEPEWHRLDLESLSGAPEFESYLKFYEGVDLRSKAMGEFLKNRAGKNIPVAAVLGGFHAGRVKEFLRKENIAFAVFSPNITAVEAGQEAVYLSVFSKEKTPLDRIFEGRPLLINPSNVNAGGPGFQEGKTSRGILMTSAVLAAGAGASLAEWKYGAVSEILGGLVRVTVNAYGAVSSSLASERGSFLNLASGASEYLGVYHHGVVHEWFNNTISGMFPFMILAILGGGDEDPEDQQEVLSRQVDDLFRKYVEEAIAPGKFSDEFFSLFMKASEIEKKNGNSEIYEQFLPLMEIFLDEPALAFRMDRKKIWFLMSLYAQTSSAWVREKLIEFLTELGKKQVALGWVIPRRFLFELWGDLANGNDEDGQIDRRSLREFLKAVLRKKASNKMHKINLLRLLNSGIEVRQRFLFKTQTGHEPSEAEIEGQKDLDKFVILSAKKISSNARFQLKILLKRSLNFFTILDESSIPPAVNSADSYYFSLNAALENFKEFFDAIEGYFFREAPTLEEELRALVPSAKVVVPEHHVIEPAGEKEAGLPHPPYLLGEDKNILPPFWISIETRFFTPKGGIIPGLYWFLIRLSARRGWKVSEESIRRFWIPVIESGVFGTAQASFTIALIQSGMGAGWFYVLGAAALQGFYLALHEWRGKDHSDLVSVDPIVDWKYPVTIAALHAAFPVFLFLIPQNILWTGAAFVVSALILSHRIINPKSRMTAAKIRLKIRKNDEVAAGAIDSTRVAGNEARKKNNQDLYFISAKKSPALGMVFDGISEGYGEEGAFYGAQFFADQMARLKVFRPKPGMKSEPGPYDLLSPEDILGKAYKALTLASLGVIKKSFDTDKYKMGSVMAGVRAYRQKKEDGTFKLGLARVNAGDTHIIHYSAEKDETTVISTDNDLALAFQIQNKGSLPSNSSELQEVFDLHDWDWNTRTPEMEHRAYGYLQALKYVFSDQGADWARRDELTLRNAQREIERIVMEYVGDLDDISFIQQQFDLHEVNPGDRVIILSDGIYKNIHKDDFLQMIRDFPRADGLSGALVSQARAKSQNGGGVRDDMTAVVLNVDEKWGRDLVFDSGDPVTSFPSSPVLYMKARPSQWRTFRASIPTQRENLETLMRGRKDWADSMAIYEGSFLLEARDKIFELDRDEDGWPLVRFYNKSEGPTKGVILSQRLLTFSNGRLIPTPLKMFGDDFQIWKSSLHGPFYIFDGTLHGKVVTGQELPEIEDPHWIHRSRPPPAGSATVPVVVFIIEKVFGHNAAQFWAARAGWFETIFIGALPGLLVPFGWFIALQAAFFLLHFPMRNWLKESHQVSASPGLGWIAANLHVTAPLASLLLHYAQPSFPRFLLIYSLLFLVIGKMHQEFWIRHEMRQAGEEVSSVFPRMRDWKASIPLWGRVWGAGETPRLVDGGLEDPKEKPWVILDSKGFSHFLKESVSTAKTELRLGLVYLYLRLYSMMELSPGSTLPRNLEEIFNPKFSGREQLRGAVAHVIREKEFSGQPLNPDHPFLIWLSEQVAELSEDHPAEAQRFLYTLLIGLGAFSISRKIFVAGLTSGIEVLVPEQLYFRAFDFNPVVERTYQDWKAGEFEANAEIKTDINKGLGGFLGVSQVDILKRPDGEEVDDLFVEIGKAGHEFEREVRKPVLMFKHSEAWIRAFRDNGGRRGGKNGVETDRLLRQVFSDIIRKFRVTYPSQPIVVLDDPQDDPSVLRAVLEDNAYGDLSPYWPEAIRENLKIIEDKVVEVDTGKGLATTLLGRISVFYPTDRDWEEKVEFLGGKTRPDTDQGYGVGTIPILVWVFEKAAHWGIGPFWYLWEKTFNRERRAAERAWDRAKKGGGHFYVEYAGWIESFLFFFLPALSGSLNLLAGTSVLFVALHFPMKNWLRVRHGIYPGRGVAMFNAVGGFAYGALLIFIMGTRLSAPTISLLGVMFYLIAGWIHQTANENRMFENAVWSLNKLFPLLKTKNIIIDRTVIHPKHLTDTGHGIVHLAFGWDGERKIHISRSRLNYWKRKRRELRPGRSNYKVVDFRISLLSTYLHHLGVPFKDLTRAGFSLEDPYFSQTQDSTEEDLFRRAILLLHRYLETLDLELTTRTAESVRLAEHLPEGPGALKARLLIWLAKQVERNQRKAVGSRQKIAHLIEAQKMLLTLLAVAGYLPSPGDGRVYSLMSGKDWLLFEQAEGLIAHEKDFNVDEPWIFSQAVRKTTGVGLRTDDLRQNRIKKNGPIDSGEFPETIVLNNAEFVYEKENSDISFKDAFTRELDALPERTGGYTFIVSEAPDKTGIKDVLKSRGYIEEIWAGSISPLMGGEAGFPVEEIKLKGEENLGLVIGGKTTVYRIPSEKSGEAEKSIPEFIEDLVDKEEEFPLDFTPAELEKMMEGSRANVKNYHPSYVDQGARKVQPKPFSFYLKNAVFMSIIAGPFVLYVIIESLIIDFYTWLIFRGWIKPSKGQKGKAEKQALTPEEDLVEFLSRTDPIRVSDLAVVPVVKKAISFEKEIGEKNITSDHLKELRSLLTGAKKNGLSAGMVKTLQAKEEYIETPVLAYHFINAKSKEAAQGEVIDILAERMKSEFKNLEIGFVTSEGAWVDFLGGTAAQFGLPNVHVVRMGSYDNLQNLLDKSHQAKKNFPVQEAKIHLYIPADQTLRDDFIPKAENWEDRIRVFMVLKALQRVLAIEVGGMKDWFKTVALVLRQA